MIQIFYTDEENRLVTVDEQNVDGLDYTGKWIHLSNPTDKEIEFVGGVTAIPKIILKPHWTKRSARVSTLKTA